MKTPSRPLLLALATLAISALAFADTYPMIKPQTSPVHKTNVSGSTGDDVLLGDGTGFLKGFEWSERSDNPCWFRVLASFREKDAGWTDVNKETSVNSCTKHEASLKTVQFQGSNPRFIRSVQVCTSDKKDGDKNKLKGIRIRSARFDDATSKLIPEEGVESAYRSNCKTWHQEVSCPEGQGATAIHLQKGGQQGYADTSYRGIALQCAAPQQPPPPPSPVPGPVKKPGGFGFGK
jgi:hypothetical protein